MRPRSILRMDRSTLAPADRVVLATPAWATQDLVPGVAAPNEFRSIVNAHFALPAPAGAAPMTGVIGGTAEWVFAFHDRLSVTVSGADAIVDQDRETLARDAVARRGRRARAVGTTCRPGRSSRSAARPSPRRPSRPPGAPAAKTRWTNLILAGDWTDTGLPATIEGAIRSGHRAAQLALAASSV